MNESISLTHKRMTEEASWKGFLRLAGFESSDLNRRLEQETCVFGTKVFRTDTPQYHATDTGTETMKLHHFLKSTVAGLACAGTLVPGSLVQAAETTAKAPANKPASIVRDLSLTKDGVLQGQVSNAKKAATASLTVSIRKERKEVNRTRTDNKGCFEVKGLKPGTYYIVAGTGHGLYRVWASNIAPPKALKSARIISDKTLIRAQNSDGGILYDENGVAYGQVRIVDNGGLVPVSPGGAFAAPSAGFLDSLGLYDVLLIGGVGAGIGLGVAALNEAEDNNNPPPPPPATP